jgi:hypothetical protein
MKERRELRSEFQVRDELYRLRHFNMCGEGELIHTAIGDGRHGCGYLRVNGRLQPNGEHLLLCDRSRFDVGIASHDSGARIRPSEGYL